MSPNRNLPALIPGQTRRDESPKARATAIDAQVEGQTGQRRGLRGGQPVLSAARAAYLDAEWRGHDDRRLPTGTLRVVAV
jgi:hypothetical protein